MHVSHTCTHTHTHIQKNRSTVLGTAMTGDQIVRQCCHLLEYYETSHLSKDLFLRRHFDIMGVKIIRLIIMVEFFLLIMSMLDHWHIVNVFTSNLLMHKL